MGDPAAPAGIGTVGFHARRARPARVAGVFVPGVAVAECGVRRYGTAGEEVETRAPPGGDRVS